MASSSGHPKLTVDQALPGLPKKRLTPEQQLDALKKVQARADHRAKLGAQFFKAAEAHLTHHQDWLEQIKKSQNELRQELQDDVAKSLRSYDQWMGKMDQDFTQSLERLEARIDELQTQWSQAQEKIESMMRRSEAMLDQGRYLMAEAAHGHPARSPGNVAQTTKSAKPVESAPVAKQPEPEAAKPDESRVDSRSEHHADTIYTRVLKQHDDEAA